MSSAARTLLLGRDGLLGSHFYRRLLQTDPEVFASSYRSGAQPFLDLTLPHSHDWQALYAEGYRYALLTASNSRLAYCESHPLESAELNLDATLRLAGELSQAGICPVLFSSDYVFDGLSGGYRDEARPRPLNVYGRQKAALEARLAQACDGAYLCLRLSKVYTHERGDGTLLDEICNRLWRQEPVLAATDQYMSPILIEDALAAIQALIASEARGLFNLCAPEVWSRYEIACLLADLLGKPSAAVRSIQLADLNENFLRPQRTDLRASRLNARINAQFTPLRDSAGQLAQAYLARADRHV